MSAWAGDRPAAVAAPRDGAAVGMPAGTAARLCPSQTGWRAARRAARAVVPLAAALATLVAGCAAVPPAAPVLSGRLSLQVAAHAGAPARGFHAAFDLVGDATRGALRLSTPLGPQVAQAQWAPGGATLRTADGESRHPSLEALAAQALGEPVPLQALPDWLRGRPWAGAVSEPAGAGFVQLGWTIDLARWPEGFVVARRDTPPAVTLRVRLQAPPGPAARAPGAGPGARPGVTAPRAA